MSLQSIVLDYCKAKKLPAPSFEPREEFSDTRVQVGKRFFHARNQRPEETEESYAHYLAPHLAELA